MLDRGACGSFLRSLTKPSALRCLEWGFPPPAEPSLCVVGLARPSFSSPGLPSALQSRYALVLGPWTLSLCLRAYVFSISLPRPTLCAARVWGSKNSLSLFFLEAWSPNPWTIRNSSGLVFKRKKKIFFNSLKVLCEIILFCYALGKYNPW